YILSSTACSPLYVLSFFSSSRTPVTYTLSLHDALPIYDARLQRDRLAGQAVGIAAAIPAFVVPQRDQRAGLDETVGAVGQQFVRSEEHTSELQSRENLVCRLLLEKKKRR